MLKKILKNKYISFFVISILLISAFVLPFAHASKLPSDYKIGMSFQSALNSQRPMVALFYADWCGYCKRFMPTFNTLSYKYGAKYNFVMVNVDGSEYNKQLSYQMKIRGLPTVFIIDPVYKNQIKIPSSNYGDFKAMSAKLDQYLISRNR